LKHLTSFLALKKFPTGVFYGRQNGINKPILLDGALVEPLVNQWSTFSRSETEKRMVNHYTGTQLETIKQISRN
jgi:hypothetical protein